MRTGTTISEVANSIYGKAQASLARIAEVHANKVADFTVSDETALLDLTNKLMGIIGDSVALQREGDVALPKYLARFSASNGSEVEVTIRPRMNSAYKYSKSETIAFGPDFITALGNMTISALFDMLYIELARENLADLNQKVFTILSESDCGLRFSFVMDDGVKGPVAEINDEEVKFNVALNDALNKVAELGIMCQDADEYGETIRTEAAARLVEAVSEYTLTPQLLKAKNIVEISTMVAGIPTKSKVSSILRKAYHRNHVYLDKLKNEGIGYFMEDVQIGEDTVSVFALIHKDAEGNKSIMLHPFDVKALTNVEYDVIG